MKSQLLNCLSRIVSENLDLDEIEKLFESLKKEDQTMTELNKLIKDTPVEKQALISASSFLLYFEGCYVASIDRICLLLIMSGHDLYDFFRRKFAKTLEEIGNIDINTKFRFLEEHGFKRLVRQRDRELRNKIAHLDFVVEGKFIKINGENVCAVGRLINLCIFTDKIFNVLIEVLAEFGNVVKEYAEKMGVQIP